VAKKPAKTTSKKKAGGKTAKSRKKTTQKPTKAGVRKGTSSKSGSARTKTVGKKSVRTRRAAAASRSKAVRPEKAAKKAVKKAVKKAARKKPATAKKKVAKTKKRASTGRKVAKLPARKAARPAATKTARRAAGSAGSKSPASARSARAAAREAPAARKTVSSGLSAKDLEFFRQRLLERRARLLGDVRTLQNEARSQSGGDSGVASSMPIHMADLGTDNYEKEFTLNLIQGERTLLREIDEALARINDGTYGICLATGKPIGKARLRAKPWAKYCYEYVLEMERRQQGSGF